MKNQPKLSPVASLISQPQKEMDQIEERIMVKSKEIRSYLKTHLRVDKFPHSPRGQKFMRECEIKGI